VNSVFELAGDTPCLLEVLGAGKAEDFAALPVPTACSNLCAIGNHASRNLSAAEIVGSRIVKDFMAWARSSYEMVIMDSPPYGVVSDALVLAGMADGVLFVSRPGVSRRHALRTAVEDFREAGAPLLGVIVNAVNFDRMSFLSNYDYRYGRGYQTYRYPTRDEGK
jgi:Mrp family chromosome partitioning ATPase